MGYWAKTKVILDSQLCFGKHNGKSIRWLIDNDIEYVMWMLNKGAIVFDHARRPEAAKVAEEYYQNRLNNL